MSKCTGINRDLTQCELEALPGSGFCFSHSQTSRRVYRAQVFTLSPEEVEARIKRLTPKQLEALEYLSGGETYESAGEVLGVVALSLVNRVSTAVKRAGVRSRCELIALYAMWRQSHTEYKSPWQWDSAKWGESTWG